MRTFTCRVLAAVFALVAGAPVIAAAQQAPAQVSGRLSVVIGDPVNRAARGETRTYVYDDASRHSYEVKIDSLMAKDFGGLIAMNAKRVSLSIGTGGRVTRVQSVTSMPQAGSANLARAIEPTAAMGLPAITVVGQRKYAILPCRFSDSPPIPTAWTSATINTLMSTGTMSVHGYWDETSASQLNLTFGPVISTWATLPNVKHYYVDEGGAFLDRLMLDCMTAHDAAVDYSQVDGVLMQFDQQLGCCFYGGGIFETFDGVSKFFPAMWMAGTDNPSEILGTYAHEMGHTLGLMHSRPPDGNTYLSNWDVMSNSAADTVAGVAFGAQTLAVQKDFLGWIPANRRFVATGPSSTITLERNALPGANANPLIAIVPQGISQQHYYAVEFRQRAGVFEPAIPKEGVVIHDWYEWRSEMAWVVDPDGNSNVNDDGAVWTPGETFTDPKNGISITVDAISGTSATLTIRNAKGVTFGLSAAGGKRTVAYGALPVKDSVQVQLAGGSGPTIPWTAERQTSEHNLVGLGRSSWMGILDNTGKGTAQVRILHDPTSLGAGTYVDSMKVSSPAFLFPIYYYDTLVVTPSASLAIGASVRGRIDSTLAPFTPSDSAKISVSGTGSTTAAWTAKSKHLWTDLAIPPNEPAKGVGNGTIYWYRRPEKTAGPGMYVDTITIKLDATPTIFATIIDTFKVDPTVQYTITPRGRTFHMPQGADSVLDSVSVKLNGHYAVDGLWIAKTANVNKANQFIDPVGNIHREVRGLGEWKGIGNGMAYYRRGKSTLFPGTYIDSLWIAGPYSGFSPTDPNVPVGHQLIQYVIDTLIVDEVPRSLELSLHGRRDTVALGMSEGRDSIQVRPLGPNASNTIWQATSRHGRAVLTVGNTGNFGQYKAASWMLWERKTDGLVPGIYVDTIDIVTVEDGPASAMMIDTMVVAPSASMFAPSPIHIAALISGELARTDSADVVLLGTAGSTVNWSASKTQAWTILTTSTGTGTGRVRWSRNTNGLAPGLYRDSIAIVSTNTAVRGQFVIDSFTVALPPVLNTIGTSPDSVDVLSGTNVSSTLSANLLPTGATLGSYSATVTWNSALLVFDSVRAVTNGFGTPAAGSATASSVVISGTNVTGKAGQIDLAQLWFHATGSAVATASINPSITTAFTPGGTPIDLHYTVAPGASGRVHVITAAMSLSSAGRKKIGTAGQAPVTDSVDVTMAGPTGGTVAWTAVKKGAWNTLTTGSGVGTGRVRWTRAASNLSMGMYIDTITVSGTGVATSTVIDTFVVNAPSIFANAAVSPDSSGGVIGLEIPATVSLDLTAVAQTLGSYAATVKWDSTVIHLDSAVAVSGGFAAPTVTFNNAGQISISAADATGKAGIVSLARLHFRVVADVTGVQTLITPAFTAAASIASQQTNLLPTVVPKVGKIAIIAGALRGDVDLDGRVTMADAQAIIRAAAKISTAGIRSTPNGDVNCDGKVTALDAQIVLRKLVGLPVDQFCVGTIK